MGWSNVGSGVVCVYMVRGTGNIYTGWIGGRVRCVIEDVYMD